MLLYSVQAWLFPRREDELGELDDTHREFVAVGQTCDPQSHLNPYRWVGNGCPPASRLALCKAFITKAVWNFPTTRDLIDAVCHRPTLRRLCGTRPAKDDRPTAYAQSLQTTPRRGFDRSASLFRKVFQRFCKRLHIPASFSQSPSVISPFFRRSRIWSSMCRRFGSKFNRSTP